MPIIASSTSGNAAGRTPPSPTFDLTASKTSLDETTDRLVTFTVTTTGLLDGTVLYYTLTGVGIDQFDFEGNSTFGSFVINSDTGSFSFTVKEDYFTEGNETVTVSLRRGNISGQIVDQQTVTISDTSEDPLYVINVPSTSVDEGSSFTFDVTTDKPIADTVYYTLDGSNIDDDDFTTVAYGTISLGAAPPGGTASKLTTINIESDYITEGLETFVINVRSGGYTGGIYTTSPSIQINDTADYPEVFIVPDSLSVDEGDNLGITFTTSGAPIGYTVYYSINGNAADFSTPMSGSFTIDASGTNIITLTTTQDQTTEGSETFTITARVAADETSQVLGTTDLPITINDTSQTPTYAWTSFPTTVNEGAFYSATVTTTDIFDGTDLYWKIMPSSQAADFNTTNGTITINNNTGSILFSPTSDQTTEGSETFYLALYTDSSMDEQYNVANTSSITINDTSQDPTYTIVSPVETPENVVAISTVNTTYVFNGTNLYWEVDSNTGATSADFGSLTGSTVVSVADPNAPGIPGTATINVSIAQDFDNSEYEDYFIKVYTDPSRTNLVATSSTIGILEPSFAWINAPGFVNEGVTYTFDFNAPVADGTTLYFQTRNGNEEFNYGNSYDGDWTQPSPVADNQTFFSGSNVDGSLTVSGGIGTVNLQAATDGGEYFFQQPEYYRLVIWQNFVNGLTFQTMLLDGGKQRLNYQ